jgi:hypothetical protein
MSHKSAPPTVSTIGIDLGKNSFHLVGLDQRGAIVWQLKCSRAQLERRLANIPCCLAWKHVPERITSLASLPRLDTMFVCSRHNT